MRSLTSRLCVCILFVLVLGLVSSFAEPVTYQHDLYRMEAATGQLIRSTFLGTSLAGASNLAAHNSSGWTIVGAADFDGNGVADVLLFNASTGNLELRFFGGEYQSKHLNSTFLVTPGAGWTPRAVADFNRDGQPDVLFANDRTGQADIYSYGGLQGATLVSIQTLKSELPSGWKVVGAVDVNLDGFPDLILQNSSTRQVMVSYLKDAAITGSAILGGSGLKDWTAVGMKDINGDGHPDLIYANGKTGQVMVSYYGGERGLTFLSSAYLDSTASPGWNTVVPSALPSEAMVSSGGPGALNTSSTSSATTASSSSATVLLYVGTGTSSGDVSAVKSLLQSLGLSFATVNSSQLDGMSVSELLKHKLFLMPGGNAVTIGKYLTKTATSNVRQAIGSGMHYLGLCAGGFFAGKSIYNRLQMTGVIYDFYKDYFKGVNKEAVSVALAGGTKYDIYWQAGPQLSGWGYVVGKYPDGHAAITEGKYGSGFAILCGLHPEAPASWRTGMKFNTPLSVDLAYAGTLVKAALAGNLLPHY